MKYRGRNFAFLVYPDSCKFNYVEMVKYLNRLNISMAISPLHCPDVDTKKEHYHILITFDGVKSLESLENLQDSETMNNYDFQPLCNFWGISKNNYPHFMIINSICGQFRYLIHLDNEDKQQFENIKIHKGCANLCDDNKYNTIVELGAFDHKDYLERDKKISEDIQLINIVKENNLRNEQQLLFYLADNKNIGLINYVHNNLYFVKNFLFANTTLINKIYGKNKKLDMAKPVQAVE